MRLVDKLSRLSKRTLEEVYYSLYGNSYNNKQLDKEYLIENIKNYYLDCNHYPYLFSDAEIAYLESEYEPKLKKVLFAREIESLKDRYFIHYDSKNQGYVLFDELIPVYQEYCKQYSKDEREKFGLYRFLTIAYIYAYGVLSLDDMNGLLSEIFTEYKESEWKKCIQDSNGYQGKIILKKEKGDCFFCINDEEFAGVTIELKEDSLIEDYAVLDEDVLMAYYINGYDSTNNALTELEKILSLSKKEKKEFLDLIIYTYGLLQNKEELLDFILSKLRYDFVSNSVIIKAFELVDKAYYTYGSFITKGYSPEMFENILKENFDMMNTFTEANEEYKEKEEPVN